MLYLSTRNKADSFTAHCVLHSESAPDGGMFLPMQLPTQDDSALAAYEQMNFSEAIASVLNLFFGTRISAWDVDFAVGRQAVELASCGYKISLAESWHNPDASHKYFVNRLYSLVTGEKHPLIAPNTWFHIAVDIALLFGVYGKYCRQEIYNFDVAIEAGDLQQLFAVRYAQKMGLPVKNVILGTVEDDGLWELISYGEYQTFRLNALTGLEAMLWIEFGYSEVQKFLHCGQKKMTYRMNIAGCDAFRKGIFVAVVGDKRAKNLVENILHTSNYCMELSTARAFSALQDYRAKTGENKNTLLFAKNGPNL